MADKKISELTAYTPAVDVDLVPIVDTTAGITKHITWANIKATLKTYFDSLTTTLTNKTLTSPKINEDVALTATATQLNTIVGLAKATAAENVTGTDDAKFLTALANVPAFNNSLARQAIINGNFDVWQRGTSFTNIERYTSDRYTIFTSVDGGTAPANNINSRQIITSGAIANAFYCYRVAIDGAGSSLGNNSYYRLTQKIENGARYLCGDGKKITVSFWAKSDIAGKKIGIGCFQNYGSGGSPSAFEALQGEVFTLTSSWVKYTFTFTTNTLSGKTFGTANDDSLQLFFMYQWGSTYGGTYMKTGVSAEGWGGAGLIDIAQVQLCAGDVALPFMPKSFEEELRACMRYCYVINSADDVYSPLGIAQADSTTLAFLTFMFGNPMRVEPTVVMAGDWDLISTRITSYTAENGSRFGKILALSVASGLTAGHSYRCTSSNTTAASVTFSAEL